MGPSLASPFSFVPTAQRGAWLDNLCNTRSTNLSVLYVRIHAKKKRQQNTKVTTDRFGSLSCVFVLRKLGLL